MPYKIANYSTCADVFAYAEGDIESFWQQYFLELVSLSSTVVCHDPKVEFWDQ